MAGRFSVEAVFSAVDRMSRPVGRMAGAVDRFARSADKSLDKVGARLGKVHEKLKTGAVVAAAGGAALGAASVNVLSAGADFEQAITNVGAVSLMTRDQVAELEKKAIELGASTRFSATEVAQGMELMGRAGFDNKQTLAGIEGVLNAAAAEGAELAETAGNISNVLKGMNLDVSKSTEVADVLTLASARTNSSISSLAESMSTASTTATQFQVPLKDTVAAVALLQDVGLDASEAGSAFNTMLTRLAKPTDEVAYKMAAMGVKFQDAKGNMLPFKEVLQNMAKAAQKSGGNMKQAAFFADLVGMRGQKAAIKLKDLFLSGKVEELTAALENASGSAEKMAKIRMDTLLGDWETFNGSIDSVKISIFDLQNGPLRGLVQGMTAWVDANHDLIVSKVQDFIMGIKEKLPEFVTWLKETWKWVSGVGETIRSHLPEWAAMAKWTFRAVVAFYALSAAVKIAQLAVVGWKTVVWAAQAAKWAWVTVTGKATLAQKLFTAATKEGTTATDIATVANKGYADAMKMMGGETDVAVGKFAGFRKALNASKLGTQINGVKSLLGKAGLLGAAAAVGYEFGSWLNETFKLDEKISGWIAQLTGIEKQLEAAGGRASHKGVGEKDDKVYADGTIVGADGTIKTKGSEWQKHMPKPAAPPMVTPQERAAAAVNESTTTTTTEQVEVVIKDKTGKATIKRGSRPARGASIRLDPSGAY